MSYFLYSDSVATFNIKNYTAEVKQTSLQEVCTALLIKTEVYWVMTQC